MAVDRSMSTVFLEVTNILMLVAIVVVRLQCMASAYGHMGAYEHSTHTQNKRICTWGMMRMHTAYSKRRCTSILHACKQDAHGLLVLHLCMELK